MSVYSTAHKENLSFDEFEKLVKFVKPVFLLSISMCKYGSSKVQVKSVTKL